MLCAQENVTVQECIYLHVWLHPCLAFVGVSETRCCNCNLFLVFSCLQRPRSGVPKELIFLQGTELSLTPNTQRRSISNGLDRFVPEGLSCLSSSCELAEALFLCCGNGNGMWHDVHSSWELILAGPAPEDVMVELVSLQGDLFFVVLNLETLRVWSSGCCSDCWEKQKS